MIHILYRGLDDLPHDIRVKINQEIRDLPSLKHISETNRTGRESATEILNSFKPLLRAVVPTAGCGRGPRTKKSARICTNRTNCTIGWSIPKGDLFSRAAIQRPHASISDTDMINFAAACANGALAQVTYLNLRSNQIGNAGLSALATACAKGALAQVTGLTLSFNQIGDAGLSALATACDNGALESLEDLYVDAGFAGTEHPALEAACNARGIYVNLDMFWEHERASG